MMKSHDLHALHEALGVLKLDQIALSLDALCQQAAKEEWTYSTFLARLLDEELSAREQRRLSVTTKMAHFPFHKTLEQFDFEASPPTCPSSPVWKNGGFRNSRVCALSPAAKMCCYLGLQVWAKRIFPFPLASKP